MRFPHLGFGGQLVGFARLIRAFRHVLEHGGHGDGFGRHGKRGLCRERVGKASLAGALPGAERLSLAWIRRRDGDLFSLFVRAASRAVFYGQLVGLLLRGRRLRSRFGFGRLPVGRILRRRFLGGRLLGRGRLFPLYGEGRRLGCRGSRGAAGSGVNQTLVAAARHIAKGDGTGRRAGAQDRIADPAPFGGKDIYVVIGGVGRLPGDLYISLVVDGRLYRLDGLGIGGRIIGNAVVTDAGIGAVRGGTGFAVSPSRHGAGGVPLHRADGAVLHHLFNDPHVVHIAGIFRPVEIDQIARRGEILVPRIIGHPVGIRPGIPGGLDHRGGNARLARDPGNEIGAPRHISAAEGVFAAVGLAQFVQGDRDHVLSLVAGDERAVLQLCAGVGEIEPSGIRFVSRPAPAALDLRHRHFGVERQRDKRVGGRVGFLFQSRGIPDGVYVGRLGGAFPIGLQIGGVHPSRLAAVGGFAPAPRNLGKRDHRAVGDRDELFAACSRAFPEAQRRGDQIGALGEGGSRLPSFGAAAFRDVLRVVQKEPSGFAAGRRFPPVSRNLRHFDLGAAADRADLIVFRAGARPEIDAVVGRDPVCTGLIVGQNLRRKKRRKKRDRKDQRKKSFHFHNGNPP